MTPAELRAKVVYVARKNIGYGETTANNKGPFIEAIGGKQGMEWCALLAGYCYRRAYQLLGEEPPPWLYRRPGVAEPGALRLWRGLLEAGERTDMLDVESGDLVLWRRAGGHHIAVVEYFDADGMLHTIEGNVGRYPAKVRRLVHDVTKEPHFRGIAGLR